MNQVKFFLQKISNHSKERVICFKNSQYSYSQIVDKSYDLARFIESHKYKKVFFNLKNSPLSICLYIASWIANIELLVPINPRLIDKELIDILESDSLFITDDNIYSTEFQNKAKNHNIQILAINDTVDFLNSLDKTDNFEIHQKAKIAHISSGTTGFYKQHLHSISQIIKYAQNISYKLGLVDDEELLIVLSVNHAFAFSYQLLPALEMGLNISIMQEFNPQEVAKKISESSVTALALLPTMYYFLTKENISRHNLRYLGVAGDVASEELNYLVKDKFGLSLLNGIGMTEVFGYGQNITHNQNNKVIKIFADTQIKIEKFNNTNYGKILLKNDMLPLNLNTEYLDTGDIGSFNIQTRELTFYARHKDVIIKGGSNIVPIEIETAIKKYSKITDVVVIGKKDNIWGEIICAFVVSNDDISLNELNRHLEKYVAKYKLVDEIFRIKKIPITSTGKLDRESLKTIVEKR